MSKTKATRSQNTGKTNCAPKRKEKSTARITRATSARDRFYRIAAEPPLNDQDFLRDEAILADVMSYIPFEERREIGTYEIGAVAISCGTPNFQAELLPFLGRAMKNRQEWLNPLLTRIRAFFESRLHDHYPDLSWAERETATIHVIAAAQASYWEGIEDEAVIAWIWGKMEETVKFLRAIREVDANEKRRFVHILSTTQSDARAGVWSILKGCCDLGADEGEVEEVVQATYSKIWRDISTWMDDGSAQLSTRVYKFARAQALGWRTDRIRSKAPNDLEKLEAKMIALSDSRKLPPRPISLGPGREVSDDKNGRGGKNGKEPKAKRNPKPRNLMGISLEELWNPLTLVEQKFTEAQLAAELRSAGPFRA